MRTSEAESRSQSGLMQPWETRYLICSWVPPLVALEMAQAASFLMSNSAVAKRWMSGGMMPASTTVWICPGSGSKQRVMQRWRGFIQGGASG